MGIFVILGAVNECLVLIIPCHSVSSQLYTILVHMVMSPNAVNRAFRKASLLAVLPIERNDWQMLGCLYEAKKGVTLSFIVGEFNSKTKPSYHRLNSWFYMSLARLVAHELASETRTPKGWRRWQITLAGRIEIDKLNQAAIKLLEQWEAEDR